MIGREENKMNNKVPGEDVATAGLCLGIGGLLISFFIAIQLGVPVCIAGVICSGIGMKSGLDRAKWGLGLSIGGIALSILSYWYAISVLDW